MSSLREARAQLVMESVCNQRAKGLVLTAKTFATWRSRGVTPRQLEEALDDLAAEGLVRIGSRQDANTRKQVVAVWPTGEAGR
jgi:hypothetical protein